MSRRMPPIAAVVAVLLVAVLLVAAAATAAGAVEAPPKEVSTDTAELEAVIEGLRNLLVGLLATVATLFLTVGGVRYMTAGGNPGEVEKAKAALRSAAIGYGLAVLAPVFVEILQSAVGS